jgi:hypothetical protein
MMLVYVLSYNLLRNQSLVAIVSVFVLAQESLICRKTNVKAASHTLCHYTEVRPV